MIGLDMSSATFAVDPRKPLTELTFASAREATKAIEAAIDRMDLRRWFWGEGVCVQALVRASAARGEVSHLAARYLDTNVSTQPTIEHVNNLVSAASAVTLYEQTRNGDYRRLAEQALSWFESSPLATRGPRNVLEHWPGGVWADTTYMAGSFLLQYGRVFDRIDLMEEAARQWLEHAELLTVDTGGLFVHGTHAGQAIECFWGRANAWMAMSAIDILRFAPGIAGTDHIRQRVAQQLIALAELQPDHGAWDVLVEGNLETKGILETSATAGIGAAMLRFDQLYANPVIRKSGDLAVRSALAYVENGVLKRTSAGTVLQLIPFGYSVIRDDRIQPWGQALALEAVTAAIEAMGAASSATSSPEQQRGSATDQLADGGQRP